MATCPTCRIRYEDAVTQCPSDGETLLPDQAFAAQDVPLRPGDVVGEYQIEGKLGEGGFGTVYKAVHPLIGKRCAIKTLHRQFSSNPQMVSRFIAEARAVNQIRHRNIIDIFSFGALPDGRQYYLMELLDGMPFDRYLAGEGPLSAERALPILRPIARALDAAHAAGIAHRDLKPENIFLTFDDEGTPVPKLLDFGIAKLLTDGGATHKTRTGAPMGTPHYMSPEQCRGANVDHRTDVYAYGVLSHVVLTGRVPFDGTSVMDVLMMHMNDAPPRMSDQVPGLPPGLDAAVQHMLAKNADARPQSVGAAFEELNDAARAAGYAVRPNTVLRSGAPGTSASGVSGEQAVSLAASTGPTVPFGTDKTLAREAPSKTFTPAASDIPPDAKRRRLALYAGVGLGVLAAGLAAGFFVLRDRPAAAPSTSGVATIASTPGTVATTVAPPSVPGATSATPSTSSPISSPPPPATLTAPAASTIESATAPSSSTVAPRRAPTVAPRPHLPAASNSAVSPELERPTF